MTGCDHRIWLELNGPELHLYNRSALYARLEKLFGLESQLTSPAAPPPEDGGEGGDVQQLGQQQQQEEDLGFWTDWRDLIPVIKFDLNMVILILVYPCVLAHIKKIS